MKLSPRHVPKTEAAATYSAAAISPGQTPWRQARYCVVDLELTGLDPKRDEIISFGAVPIDEGRIVANQSLYGLVHPTRPIPEQSVLIHGIRTADLAGAPELEQALSPLLIAMSGRVLVVHAAEVERAFLGPAFRRLGTRLRKPVLDTQVLGRLLRAERSGFAPRWLSLSELVADLGLPSHRPHNALGDALTTAQSFIAIASHLDAAAPESVRSLSRAPQRLELSRRDAAEPR